MTKQTYLAAIAGETGNYSVVFLDFPGCTSAGDTVEQAAANAREALGGHIAVSLDYGDDIPPPSPHGLADLEAAYGDPDDPTPWVALVPIEVDVPARPEHVRVDIPRSLFEEIHRRDVNTGRFIVEATQNELARRKMSA